MDLNTFYKSVLEADEQQIVLCDLEHTIIYMNPAAIKRYSKRGGKNLIGKSLLDCHNEKSGILINNVISWFKESIDHNKIYTFYNEKENKDVYMIALRNDNGELIGYYEKHEIRNRETSKMYDFERRFL